MAEPQTGTTAQTQAPPAPAPAIDLTAGLVPKSAAPTASSPASAPPKTVASPAIDLSAGLVPKSASAGVSGAAAPAPTSIRDLQANPKSEGTYQMHAPKSGPTAVASIPFSQVQAARKLGYEVAPADADRYAKDSAATIPDWRDRTIAYLTRPTPGADQTKGWEAWTGGLDLAHPLTDAHPQGTPEADAYHISPQTVARNALGGAAALLLHPIDAAHGIVTQTADGLLAAQAYARGMRTDADFDRAEAEVREHPEKFGGADSQVYKGALEDLTRQREALANTKAMLTQAAHQLKHDPNAFIGQQLGQAALMHGVSEAGGAARDVVAAKIADTDVPGKIAAWATNVTPKATEKLVRDVIEKNDKVTAENATRDQAYESRIAKAKGDAEENAAKAQQIIADAQAVEGDPANPQAPGQRAQLSRQFLELSNRINQRIKDIRASVKGTVDQQFDKVRSLVDNVPGQQAEIAQDRFGKPFAELSPEQQVEVTTAIKPKTTPISPLAESVAKAQAKYLRGSVDSNRILEGIVQQGQQAAAEAGVKDETARAVYRKNYAELDPAQQATVDKHVGEYQENYSADRVGESPASQGIDFHHLRGLSSDLGKAAYATNDPALRAALLEVKTTADGMVDSLAGKYAPKLRTAKKNYAVFRSFFDEPTGPSGSGSRVAQSIDAADDYNAAKPFLDQQESVYKRARNMLVGSGTGATPHYDPGAGNLIDRLRAVHRKLEALPTPERNQTAIAKAQGDLAESQQQITEALVRKPGETSEPLTDVTPEYLTKDRMAKIQDRLDKARELSIMDWRMVGAGGLGLVAGIANTIAHFESPLAAGVELGAGLSILGRSMGPKMIAWLLDRPGVVEQLAKPTLADYRRVMVLPEAQRTGVAEAMAELEREAQQRGKIPAGKTPWQSFARTVVPVATGATAPGRADQAQEKAQAAAGTGSSTATPDQTSQQLADELARDLAATTGGR